MAKCNQGHDFRVYRDKAMLHEKFKKNTSNRNPK